MECSPHSNNVFKFYLLILVFRCYRLLHLTGHQAANTRITRALSYQHSETTLIICFKTRHVLSTENCLWGNGISRFSVSKKKNLVAFLSQFKIFISYPQNPLPSRISVSKGTLLNTILRVFLVSLSQVWTVIVTQRQCRCTVTGPTVACFPTLTGTHTKPTPTNCCLDLPLSRSVGWWRG
jgi:hypothetical protein